MSDPAIVVEQLSKTYVVPVRGGGLTAALQSLVRRQTRAVEAVCQVDFEVEAGEVVGFLGPNGAGKTTTLKMLSGLLHPTAGNARVLGYVPHRRDRTYLRHRGRSHRVRGDRPRRGDLRPPDGMDAPLRGGAGRGDVDALALVLDVRPEALFWRQRVSPPPGRGAEA
jgi:energy-coupling factor transporter ATP-binding protein EcfA2